jgi:hypothetical protein
MIRETDRQGAVSVSIPKPQASRNLAVATIAFTICFTSWGS